MNADEGNGKAAVADYFGTLGDLIAFWRVKYAWSGGRVVVLVEERFTLQPIGVTAQSELALIFDVHRGWITRLLVVEDLPAALTGTAEGRAPRDGNELERLAQREISRLRWNAR